MNEKTMIWFLQKTKKYELSSDAMSLWMDFYTYLQNQSRACNPQIPFFTHATVEKSYAKGNG